MTADLMSRPYRPNPNLCCEACVFGRGEHAEWCEKRVPGCNRCPRKCDAKRRAVAKGALAGKPLAAIAKAAGCSKRHVQRLEREPETQFLIVEALRPHRAVLTKMAGKALRVIERAFMARKTDGADRIVQLRAVERYHEMMDLAQGTAKPPDQEDRGQVTWEEFVVMYRARKETHESNPPDSSPLG